MYRAGAQPLGSWLASDICCVSHRSGEQAPDQVSITNEHALWGLLQLFFLELPLGQGHAASSFARWAQANHLALTEGQEPSPVSVRLRCTLHVLGQSMMRQSLC